MEQCILPTLLAGIPVLIVDLGCIEAAVEAAGKRDLNFQHRHQNSHCVDLNILILGMQESRRRDSREDGLAGKIGLPLEQVMHALRNKDV